MIIALLIVSGLLNLILWQGIRSEVRKRTLAEDALNAYFEIFHEED